MTSWSCSHCTLVNMTSSPLCGACGSENPSLATRQKKSIIPRSIIKPINSLSNAIVDIFTISSDDGPSQRPPPRPAAPYQSSSTSPFPKKTPPPPRPPPPTYTIDSDGTRLGMPSSSSAPSLDYSMTWMCRFCYHQNQMEANKCTGCSQTRNIGSKRQMNRLSSPRSAATLSNVRRSTDHPTDFNSSLCSEITAQVEQRDIQQAAVTYDSILAFCQSEKTSFIDDSFPHSPKSIGDLTSSSSSGDAVVGTVPREFSWLRPQQIFTKDGRSWTWSVFRDPRPSDIEQGVLGDCWLLSAMALIAERPDILEHIIVTKEYAPSGVYQVRICMDGEWRMTLVDDFFPCRTSNRTLAFATGRKNQLWVPLIEKALAKQLGSYAKLVGGRTIEALAMLTGAPCEQLSLESQNDHHDVLWAQLLSAREAGFVMGCSCGSGVRKVDEEAFRRMGLLTRHAYSILDVTQYGQNRLLRLRNPWGSFVWKGAWSEGWNGWNNDMRTALHGSSLSSDNDTGCFWMSFQDFAAHFDSVDIAKIRSFSGWSELRIPVKMGGIYQQWDRSVRILIEQPTEVCFTLYQAGSRSIVDRVDLLVCIHKISPGGQIGELVCRSPRKIEASTCTGDVFLSSGEYIAVCHSMSTLGARKVEGCLAIHSSRPVFGDTIACCSDMYTDSLVQMTLAEGQLHTSLQGVVPRYISSDFGGLLLMIDNLMEDMWIHVKTECSDSTNVLSSRGTLDVADVIPPLSRQIIIILTHFEPSNSYMVQHKLSVRLSRRSTLGEMAMSARDATATHSPPFSSSSINMAHGTKPLFI